MAQIEAHYNLPLPEFGTPVKLLIVVAPYYKDIADQLIEGAMGVAASCQAQTDIVNVPGALEIPPAIALAHQIAPHKYDGYVALGCVIRGETTHYEIVSTDSSRALMQLGLQGLCIGNGILTVENHSQAQERAKVAGDNKGGGAVAAALHLIALSHQWKASKNNCGPSK